MRKPSDADLIACAESMIPRLRERAIAADKAGKLAANTVRELRSAGFFRILQPDAFGGYGMHPATLWEVTRQLGRGCSSTAFIVSLLGIHVWIVGMFEADVQKEVFQDDNDAVVSNLSIGVRRSNQITHSKDGYLVSGTWDYASGIDFADWVTVAIRVAGEDGSFEEKLALVPQDQFVIDPDSWNVLGARGTGSKTVSLKEIHVPRYRTISWEDVQRGAYPGAAVNKGPLYQLSAGSLLVLSSAAPVVAVAGAAIDCLVDTMKDRSLEKREWLQVELGWCASQVYMAHALLIHDANETYNWGAAERDLPVEIQARHRADAAVMCRIALAAAERALLAVGGRILPAGNSAERILRDIYAIASHFRVQPEPACGLYGRVLLGLEPH